MDRNSPGFDVADNFIGFGKKSLANHPIGN
jgi:hypothetical protein